MRIKQKNIYFVASSLAATVSVVGVGVDGIDGVLDAATEVGLLDRPRDVVDVDVVVVTVVAGVVLVVDADAVVETGSLEANSFDGVDARESLSLPLSGFFGFGVAAKLKKKIISTIIKKNNDNKAPINFLFLHYTKY